MASLPADTVWTGHPSHWHYFWRWFFGILLTPVVVGIGIIIWIFMDRARRTFIVTPQRIIVESGLFAKNSHEVRIRDIRSISVKRRGFLGLFGIGDVEFSSSATDEADITFASISEAEKVRDRVREYQSAT